MNIKAEVYRQMIAKLSSEKDAIGYDIRSTKYEMKRLAEKQTINKRKLAELQELINGLTAKRANLKTKEQHD